MHEFFGSGAILRGAEIVLGLQMKSAGYSRLHFFKDRDGELTVGTEWGLLVRSRVRVPARSERRQAAGDSQGQGSGHLEVDPGLTEDELRTRTGYAERTVRDALGATFSTGPDGVRFWTLLGGDMTGSGSAAVRHPPATGNRAPMRQPLLPAGEIGAYWRRETKTFAELLIDCEEDHYARAVILGMLREEQLRGGRGG